MGAWGHALRRLTERERVNRYEWQGKVTENPVKCSGPLCDEPALFAFTYRYVTGRRGRVSRQQKSLCQQHAERTAKKYQLELPAEPATPPLVYRCERCRRQFTAGEPMCNSRECLPRNEARSIDGSLTLSDLARRRGGRS